MGLTMDMDVFLVMVPLATVAMLDMDIMDMLTMVTMAMGILESVKLNPMPRLILMLMPTLLDRSMVDSLNTMLMLPAMLIMLDTLPVLTMDMDVFLVMVPLLTVAMLDMDILDMLAMLDITLDKLTMMQII